MRLTTELLHTDAAILPQAHIQSHRVQERGRNDDIRQLRDASGQETLYTYPINDETLMSRSFVCYESVAYGHRAATPTPRSPISPRMYWLITSSQRPIAPSCSTCTTDKPGHRCWQKTLFETRDIGEDRGRRSWVQPHAAQELPLL